MCRDVDDEARSVGMADGLVKRLGPGYLGNCPGYPEGARDMAESAREVSEVIRSAAEEATKSAAGARAVLQEM